jgi:toxin ParE1/3/4
MPCRLTRRAEADLAEIGACIAADDPPAAIRFIGEIEKACGLPGRSPPLRRARPEIALAARSRPVGRYLILCRALDEGFEIVRVVHGARRLDRTLFWQRQIRVVLWAPGPSASGCDRMHPASGRSLAGAGRLAYHWSIMQQRLLRGRARNGGRRGR